MAAPQEVEIKFLVSDLKALEQKLRDWVSRASRLPRTRSIRFTTCRGRTTPQGRASAAAPVRREMEADAQGKGHARPAQVARRIGDGRLRRQADGCLLRALGYRRRSSTRNFARNGVMDKGTSCWITHPSEMSPRSKASRTGLIARRGRWALKPTDYITKSYAELFFDWKRKTNRRQRT